MADSGLRDLCEGKDLTLTNTMSLEKTLDLCFVSDYLCGNR